MADATEPAAESILITLARDVGARLKARGQTIAVAESAAGGLIAASLLAIPGASAWVLGGAVVYTRAARAGLLGIPEGAMKGLRPSTQPYALLLARTVRERVEASWGLAETGASGPTGNAYGDLPGHACLAVVGPSGEAATTLETARSDRILNMQTFAQRALELLAKHLA